ncbi:MAG: TetR/AcrR family transcriptional regulator C-terminal domain-containing protein [Candidatus Pristimantibacillus lignocellulolyticus]|uniref:TetR/AcrR family transcriptional regulator C-terminal domain-containing protein n=1 Tax=Candidatus Pristimantibacillus lignocellulolyticus TaxID=2994561 RepID=A0A9J6ZHL2_9BACL|nr:MAG: TetR/AcrR family transcriptional regulator C-terminal domain-containing protein [Candidatus Pristimantibacillus lignocellulolyticus]
MTIRYDRRQVKTKQQLLQALLTCIEQKGLDHVTVTDIANVADLNRGTFYLHYQDVRHMVQQIMNEKIDILTELIKQVDPYEHGQYADQNIPYPRIVAILEELSADRQFYTTILGSKGDPSYVLHLKKILTGALYNKFELHIPGTSSAPVPTHYLLAYMTSAAVGMIMYWLENNLPETPNEIGAMIMNIANHGLIVSSGIREKPQSHK